MQFQPCKGQIGFTVLPFFLLLICIIGAVLGFVFGSEDAYLSTLIELAAFDPEDQPQALQAMIDELDEYTKRKSGFDRLLEREKERIRQKQSKKLFGNSEKNLDEKSVLLKNELV
jgi:hypothetical protein